VFQRKLRNLKKFNTDFQLAFAPRRFEAERLSWKLIVQLNLIRHVVIHPSNH
jgi:hypothetical protein